MLKFEDVLPYFPDFVIIDHFKDAICASLEEYNWRIETLKDEMREATENVQELREESRELRNKHTVVTADKLCAVCEFAVMSRSFYVFPCGHMFHADCLLHELKPHLKASVRSRVEELDNLLSSLSMVHSRSPVISGGASSDQQKDKNREKLAAEFDDIVASECLYCGDIMIRNIDKPFLTAEEAYSALSGWD